MFWKKKPKQPKVTPGIVTPLPTAPGSKFHYTQGSPPPVFPNRLGLTKPPESSSDDSVFNTILTAEVVESVLDSSSSADSSSSNDSSPSSDLTSGGDSGGGGANGDW